MEWTSAGAVCAIMSLTAAFSQGDNDENWAVVDPPIRAAAHLCRLMRQSSVMPLSHNLWFIR